MLSTKSKEPFKLKECKEYALLGHFENKCHEISNINRKSDRWVCNSVSMNHIKDITKVNVFTVFKIIEIYDKSVCIYSIFLDFQLTRKQKIVQELKPFV